MKGLAPSARRIRAAARHSKPEKGPGQSPGGGAAVAGGPAFHATTMRWQPRRRTPGVRVATASMASTMRRPVAPQPSRSALVADCGGGNSKVDHATGSRPAAANRARVSP